MELLSGKGEINRPCYFQLVDIEPSELRKYINFVQKNETNCWKIKEDEEYVLLMTEVNNKVVSKLKGMKGYRFHILFVEEMVPLFEKLINSGYDFRSISIPASMEDETTKEALEKYIYAKDYEGITSLIKEQNMLLNTICVSKENSDFEIRSSGAIHTLDRKKKMNEFLEILKSIF